MNRIVTIDFETWPIEKRPDYPPKPVGVAINEPGKSDYYMSWGHPTENNCTKEDARRKVKDLYKTSSILCHNGKFDLEVGEVHFGLPLVPPKGWHDSMLLAFLNNPREPSLKLKDLADTYLDMPPDEQAQLKAWLCEHVPEAKRAKTKWGRYIYLAPGKLVGRYAKGDVNRTKKLERLFYKTIAAKGMLKQYEIEKRAAIHSIEMEREGVNIDYRSLEPDLVKAKKVMKRAENAIRKTLGGINLNSGPQKIEAFERLGLVDEWEYGEPSKKKGIISPKTGIESLMKVCTDKELVHQLDTFSKYTKLISTYMQPWLDSALENNGKFYPWFNTIKGDNDKGTYTGRQSSNFQQVPRDPKDKKLPFLRNYIMADKKSHALYRRDFASQEIRILAHFEDGQLLSAFLANPKLDGHNHVKGIMEELTGKEYDRDDVVKHCNFLMVYGGGAPALSEKINVPLTEAKEILSAHGNALPGVKELKDDLSIMARRGEEFKTAGGRWYDFEPGFEYVALNTLIQGSAADHSKRALLNIDEVLKAKDYDARLMLQIHDEFMITGPRRQKKKLMADFKEAMEYNVDKLFDLDMLTDGKIGDRWGQMVSVDDQS